MPPKDHPHHSIAREFMSGRSVAEPAKLSRAVENSFATLDADFRRFEAAGLALHLLSA